jgi:hypothetical protein
MRRVTSGWSEALDQDSLNDLWKFSPSTNQWTWVSGANAVNQLSVPATLQQPAVGNVPAARNGAVGWIDGSGNI